MRAVRELDTLQNLVRQRENVLVPVVHADPDVPGKLADVDDHAEFATAGSVSPPDQGAYASHSSGMRRRAQRPGIRGSATRREGSGRRLDRLEERHQSM